MKKEYDFLEGEKGKFFSKTAKFNIPVYLDPEVKSFVMKLAKRKDVDLSNMVNFLLLKDKELIESTQ